MNIKSIGLFAIGLFVGGACGVFGTKKYFEEKYKRQYEDDLASMEGYYQRTKLYQYGDEEKESDELDYGDPADAQNDSTDSRPGGRMSSEERTSIKEKLNQNWEQTTNYAKIYEEKNHVTTENRNAENEHPLDQGEEGEEDPEYEQLKRDEEAFDEHQKNKYRPPKIISADAYSNLPASIDQQVLYFYSHDETLCDENEECIDEPEVLVGDCLYKYNFFENEEQIIFVMNYALDTCYEIQKIDASWTDAH